MAWRLSHGEHFGAVSQLHKHDLTMEEALASFFPMDSVTAKNHGASLPLCIRLCFSEGTEGTVKFEAAWDYA